MKNLDRIGHWIGNAMDELGSPFMDELGSPFEGGRVHGSHVPGSGIVTLQDDDGRTFKIEITQVSGPADTGKE